MAIRGIRGAITTDQDIPQNIREATKILLENILKANPLLTPEDIASVLFTVTNDLSSEYPAHAARELGWTQVPLLCAQEIPVLKSLPFCIRILIHWNTDLSQADIHHIYLREAATLRPDLKENQ